jgi:hypothetical protein
MQSQRPVSGDHEPRDPNPDEFHPGFQRIAGRRTTQ